MSTMIWGMDKNYDVMLLCDLYCKYFQGFIKWIFSSKITLRQVSITTRWRDPACQSTYLDGWYSVEDI